MTRHLIASVIVIAFAASAFADDFSPALQGISSPNPATVKNSEQALRNAGPDGLNALLALYDRTSDSRLIPAIDAVAGQYDAVWSRLYWYTDLPAAEAAARAQGRPILYLRLLGNLTDEYSCANSRFFRTVLYANTNVSRFLRDNYVLVWQSERPVPVMTIDFGDGRVLKRTITGNSIHYVLDLNGHVIDALPGLYDPTRFLSILERARYNAGGSPGQSYVDRADDQLLRDYQAALQLAGLPSPGDPNAPGVNLDAARAMPIAAGKGIIESPLLRQVSPAFAAELDKSIESANADVWNRLAANCCVHLDDNSIALIRSQNPSAYDQPGALQKTVQQFQQLIALDTVRNDYLLRRQILGWLRQDPSIELPRLNARVYSQLFLTPRSDPWLGMVPPDSYSALTCNGCLALAK